MDHNNFFRPPFADWRLDQYPHNRGWTAAPQQLWPLHYTDFIDPHLMDHGDNGPPAFDPFFDFADWGNEGGEDHFAQGGGLAEMQADGIYRGHQHDDRMADQDLDEMSNIDTDPFSDLDDEALSDLGEDPVLRHALPFAPRHASEEIPASLLQQTWSPQEVTDRVLEVFPDISRKHVADLYEKQSKRFVDERLCEAILEAIMEAPRYPKQREEQQAREAARAAGIKTFHEHKYYSKLCQVLLKDEFRDFDKASIKAAIAEKKTMGLAYASLKSTELAARPKRGKRRKTADPDTALQTISQDLVEFVQSELAEARLQQRKSEQQPASAAESQPSDADADLGPEVECACCFGEPPQKQSVHCAGEEPHVFCLDCLRRNVENEIGNRRCKLNCMDMSGCKAEFADHQLRLAVDQKTMDHLLRLRQQEDLKEAGIEGITECPFCDYMEVYPPIEEDREFRCGNTDCERVTCRMCKKDSHTPLTCDEAVKENKLDARHILEEALSVALIRKCNNCETKFVKVDGCNKMTCPKCHNYQCYCCGDTIKGYDHFETGKNPKKCVTYDQQGIEWRHSNDVKKAEETAKARLREQQPDVSEEDLEIQVSDAVKQKEAQQAAGAGRDPMLLRNPMLLPPWPLHADQMAHRMAAFGRQAMNERQEMNEAVRRRLEVLRGAQAANLHRAGDNPRRQPADNMPDHQHQPLGGVGFDPTPNRALDREPTYGPVEGMRGDAQDLGIADRMRKAREQMARTNAALRATEQVREQGRQRRAVAHQQAEARAAEQQRERGAIAQQQAEAQQQIMAGRAERNLAVQAKIWQYHEAFDNHRRQLERAYPGQPEHVTREMRQRMNRLNPADYLRPLAATGRGTIDPHVPDDHNPANGKNWGYDQDLFARPANNALEHLAARHREDAHAELAPKPYRTPFDAPHPLEYFRSGFPEDQPPDTVPRENVDMDDALKAHRQRHEAGMGHHLQQRRHAGVYAQRLRTQQLAQANAVGAEEKTAIANASFGLQSFDEKAARAQEARKPNRKQKRDIVDLTADSDEDS